MHAWAWILICWGLRSIASHAGAGRTGHTAPAAIGHAKLRRVVLVEGDQYYREVLTGELLRQGFVVHAFADGASLLGSLATAVDADLAVLDWDLPKMSGIKLLARTAPAWRQPARRVPGRQGDSGRR